MKKIYTCLLLTLVWHLAISQAKNTQKSISLSNQAIERLNNGDYASCISLCNKANYLDKKNYDAYFLRGRAEEYSGRYDDAIKDFNEYIKLMPNRYDGYLERGQLKDMPQVGDYIGAIQDYNIGIKLSPKNWNLFYSRGCAKDNLLDYTGAMIDYTKAISLDPTVSLPYYTRGLLKIKNGDKDGGLLDLSKSGELGYSEAYKIIQKYNKQ